MIKSYPGSGTWSREGDNCPQNNFKFALTLPSKTNFRLATCLVRILSPAFKKYIRCFRIRFISFTI